VLRRLARRHNIWLRDLFGRREHERPQRVGETVAFDVVQERNRILVEGDGFHIYFAVEGIELPSGTDASFAVWALLPAAMEEGFSLHFNQPIDPQVAANAERISHIWEMWVPSRYRSINVGGKGTWSRPQRTRLPRTQLYSGGIDSTFAILRNRDAQKHGFVTTICGIDNINEDNCGSLVAKTESLLQALNYRRIIVRNNAQHQPVWLTLGFTMASCLFLLGDLFEQGTLAADGTRAYEMAAFPWGTNHVTNEYLAGSDFAVRTVAEVGRIEKIVTLIEAGIDLHSLSFCREPHAIPANCGACAKCTRTKAMFLIATGGIPEIFIDNSFDERRMRKLIKRRDERADLFEIYFYAKSHGSLGKIPCLVDLIEECRARAHLSSF
jgi:hypothetical protein